MKTTTLQQRPLSPRTRQQQQSRLWSMVVLLLFFPAGLFGRRDTHCDGNLYFIREVP